MEAIAGQMGSEFDNDQELLSNFVEGVRSDFQNLDYQLYCNLYPIIETLLIRRFLVTGRKPPANV
jgi:hypothetical protein